MGLIALELGLGHFGVAPSVFCGWCSFLGEPSESIVFCPTVMVGS
jgi:hypothetical protein